MKVIHLIGSMGSGKTAVGEYLEKKYGYRLFNLSQIVKEAALNKDIELTRDKLNETYDLLRDKFGDDIIAKRMTDYIDSQDLKKIVLCGARHKAEVVHIQNYFPGVITIYIESCPNIRTERIKTRNRSEDAVPDSELEHLVVRDLRDTEPCKDVDGVIVIENNGLLSSLEEKIARIIGNS